MYVAWMQKRIQGIMRSPYAFICLILNRLTKILCERRYHLYIVMEI